MEDLTKKHSCRHSGCFPMWFFRPFAAVLRLKKLREAESGEPALEQERAAGQ
jgi:hypothetical protein